MQDNPAPAAVAISKPAVTKATASKKRSAPAGEPVARKRSATRAPVSKASSQDAASALPSSTPDKLSSMPPEILEMILDNVSSIGNQRPQNGSSRIARRRRLLPLTFCRPPSSTVL